MQFLKENLSMTRKLVLCGVSLIAICLMVSVQAEEEVSLEGIKCPISGKQAVKAGVAEHNGGKVYFCCTNCPKAFAANTEKFAAKANAQLVQTGQAKQTQCPLKFKPVNPAQNAEVAGVKVGFCCPGCKGKTNSAEGDAQVNLIFNDETFKKAFQVGKKEKDE